MQLKKLSTIKRTIAVHIPTDGEGFDKQKLTAEYRIINQDEINNLIENGDDDATLDRIFVGFSGVRDEDGNELENTDDNRMKLRDIPYIRQAIIRGYFKMASGGERGKN